jgi:hypothetical protein
VTIDQALQRHDLSIFIMFAAVCVFVFDWHVLTDRRIRRVMTVVPLLSVIVILALEWIAAH